MTKKYSSNYQANSIGSFWMISAMAFFAIEDVFVKLVSKTLPVSQILVVFGLGGALVFACVSLSKRERLFRADVVSKPMLLRVVFEIIGRLFYVLAIALTPLSSATVILQATPIVVVAGAALLFGESVGWRRWAAILIGLLGVVVIIRPGTDSFSMLSILAVLGMLGFAGRDLASRAAPSSLSTSILGFYGLLSVAAAGGVLCLWGSQRFLVPGVDSTLYLIGLIISGVLAYSSLMKAMRVGEVSAVTPFRYSRLIFGIAFGVLLFNERLDFPMLVGCGLIVVSGLFILWRTER